MKKSIREIFSYPSYYNIDGKYDSTGKEYNVRKLEISRHTRNKEMTGKNLNDKVNNIYDLEWNCTEYVAKKIIKHIHLFVEEEIIIIIIIMIIVTKLAYAIITMVMGTKVELAD